MKTAKSVEVHRKNSESLQGESWEFDKLTDMIKLTKESKTTYDNEANPYLTNRSYYIPLANILYIEIIETLPKESR